MKKIYLIIIISLFAFGANAQIQRVIGDSTAIGVKPGAKINLQGVVNTPYPIKGVPATAINELTTRKQVSDSLLNYQKTLSVGYGVTKSGNTITADSASATGLVSKTRLTSALANYVPTSRTVAGFPLTSNISFAGLTATNSTLSLSGLYNGSTSRTVGLNLSNANTWLAKQTFNARAEGGFIANQAVGADANFRIGSQLELNNINTGGHTIMTLYNDLPNDESAIEAVGLLSNSTKYQMMANFTRFVGDDNTAATYSTVNGTHVVGSGGDNTPFLLFSNNSVVLNAGVTSLLPWNTLPPANTTLIKGAVEVTRIGGQSSLKGTTDLALDANGANTLFLNAYGSGNIQMGIGGGNTEISNSLKLVSTPTTSASTYDILTRNTSTGMVEKVISSSLAPSTGSTAYIQNGTAQQASSNFNISGAGTIGGNLAVTGTTTLTGNLGIGQSPQTSTNIQLSSNITGSTISRGMDSRGTIQSGVISTAYYFEGLASTAASAFTLGDAVIYGARTLSIGAGSSISRVTGFWAEPTLVGGGSTYGFRGSVPSGTNRWNTYNEGSASNYFNGTTLFGTTTDNGVDKVQIVGSASVSTRFGIGNTSSSTFLNLPSGTTTSSSLRIPASVAPTTPIDGDIWRLSGRTQLYDGTVTKDVIFNKGNSTLAGFGVGNVVTDNLGNLSVAPSNIAKFYSDASNSVSSTTSLSTFTIPANTLLNDGEQLTFEYSGRFTSNSNIKTIGLDFGTTINFASTTASAKYWTIKGTITRSSSSTAILQAVLTTGTETNNVIGYQFPSLNFTISNSLILYATGTATGDITAYQGRLDYKK